MSESVFPIKHSVERQERDPTVVSLEESGAVFEALSSGTARAVVRELRDGPAPPSEIAQSLDMSLQNVSYHLARLTEGGVVEVVDTWYSSRGVEMDVYAVAADPIVVRLDSTPRDRSDRGVAARREPEAGAVDSD